MTALQEFQIQQQLTALLNQFNLDSINNATQRQNLEVNRGQALSDLRRQFDRSFEQLPTAYSRRGLETSGIRNRGIDRSLADFQRTSTRTAQGFDRQYNNLVTQNLASTANLERSIADVDAYRAASRQDLAAQIRGL